MMLRIDTRAIGTKVEQAAQRFLKKKGLTSIGQNFRCRHGEIDLIMLDTSCIVFVEVRYRAAKQRVAARLTVNRGKQRKIIRTAATFLARNPRFAQHSVRFDVVAVDGDALDWIVDAFRPSNGSF
jgi:putative endonuclease